MNNKAKIMKSIEMLHCHKLIQTVTIPNISPERSGFDRKCENSVLFFQFLDKDWKRPHKKRPGILFKTKGFGIEIASNN
jgi:hypothetical protein